MRRVLYAFTIAVTLTTGAGAITYGTPDGNAHPNVGLLIRKLGNAYRPICSGTLVSEEVFLTAGHCTDSLEENQEDAYVTFRSGPPFSVAEFLPGTPYGHPDLSADIGVVVLNDRVTDILPARIPSAAYLDGFATQRGLSSVYFTQVGYGAQSIRPRFVWELVRYQGVSDLVSLGTALFDGYLQTTANPGDERSGICFGDSGGPAFFEGTDIVVAVHAFGNNINCKGISSNYRVDIATSLDFLAGFGVTPSF